MLPGQNAGELDNGEETVGMLARSAAALGLAAALVVGAAGVAPTEASAAVPTGPQTTIPPGGAGGGMPPMPAKPGVRWDCGYVTCSVYIGRAFTRAIQTKLSRYANSSAATVATAAAAACAATGVGGVFAPLCAGAGAIYGAHVVDQFNYAAAHKMCVRIRFSAAPLPPAAAIPVVTGIYTDSSGFCGV